MWCDGLDDVVFYLFHDWGSYMGYNGGGDIRCFMVFKYEGDGSNGFTGGEGDIRDLIDLM